jgi:hypothetical protein
MGIFLNTPKADRFSYLHETGKNRPVQLYRTDRLQLWFTLFIAFAIADKAL